MEIKSFVSMDKSGVVVPSAKVYVYNQGTTNLASLFNRSNTSIGNPLTSSTSGFFEFAAKNGAYDIQFELSDGSKGLLFGVAFSDVSSITDDVIEIRSDLNVTKQTADTAKNTATIAQSTANTAKSAADEAKTEAASAKNTATTAKASADKATSDVSSLKTTVDTHSTDISTMQDTVAEASMDASESRVIAVEAKNASTKNTTDVSSLKTKVDTNTQDIATVKTDVATAKSDASSAKATADKASTDAGTALTSANSVKATADSAKSDAAEAKTVATGAKTTADEALSTVNSSATVVNGIATMEDLRARTPSFNGERVYLKKYKEQTNPLFEPVGGGWFFGTTSATGVIDDGGVRIKGPTGFWTREKGLEELEVFDFGALGDGTTDDGPAFQAMHEFMIGNYARKRSSDRSFKIGIRVGPGTFFVSPRSMQKYGSVLQPSNSEYPYYPEFDGVRYGAHNDFVMQSTVDVNYGTQLATRIISDKSDTPVFQINCRRFSIRGIEFDGQQTTKQDKISDTNPTGTNMLIGATMGIYNDTASNKQPFMINYCAGGTYANVSHFRVANTGGYGIYYFDSLDSLFDQIYSANTADNVLKFGWTNREPGGWNHSTAVKITNCNFQTAMAPCIRAPRMTQAIMDNVWTEHGCVPWDLNNGQWNMNCVSIEDFTKAACMYKCRTIITNYSAPTGVALDYTTPPSDPNYTGYALNPDGSAITNMVSDFEQGDIRLQSYGAYFNCPVRASIVSPPLFGKINEQADEWINIGEVQLPDIGTHVHINIFSRNEFGSNGSTSTAYSPTGDRSPGLTRIKIARSNNNVAVVTWHNEGAAGVTEVLVENTTFIASIPSLWIKFAKTIGTFGMFAYSTGNTRKEAGSWAMLNWSGRRVTTKPSNTRNADGMWSAHNGLAGFGFRNDVVSVQTRTSTVTKNAPSVAAVADTSQALMMVRMVIGGKNVAVPAYAWNPDIQTQPAATVNVVAGNTLSLTVVPTVSDDVARYLWQKSTDSGATWTDIANSNLQTYTKANTTAADSGQYRVILKGILENTLDNPSVTSNRKVSNPSTVTVA